MVAATRASFSALGAAACTRCISAIRDASCA
jgi:hypothetical protein